MKLNKDHWLKNDFKEFYSYEKSFVGSEHDCAWEQRIINTKLKCYGRTSTKAREVAKEIKKGNYLEFLNGIEFTSHFDTLVCAFLLNFLKDFTIFKEKVTKFAEKIDNWASSDTLRFKRFNDNDLITLSDSLLKSKFPFARRIGVNIYLELIRKEENLDGAFDMLNSLRDEKEYYVNMSAAWLLSFCMIYGREKTLDYFANNKTNSFIINKAISKCRDSYRVAKLDKDFLLNYKKGKCD